MCSFLAPGQSIDQHRDDEDDVRRETLIESLDIGQRQTIPHRAAPMADDDADGRALAARRRGAPETRTFGTRQISQSFNLRTEQRRLHDSLAGHCVLGRDGFLERG